MSPCGEISLVAPVLTINGTTIGHFDGNVIKPLQSCRLEGYPAWLLQNECVHCKRPRPFYPFWQDINTRKLHCDDCFPDKKTLICPECDFLAIY